MSSLQKSLIIQFSEVPSQKESVNKSPGTAFRSGLTNASPSLLRKNNADFLSDLIPLLKKEVNFNPLLGGIEILSWWKREKHSQAVRKPLKKSCLQTRLYLLYTQRS